MNIDSAREKVLGILSGSYPRVSVNERGSVLIGMADNPVVCRLHEIETDVIVVNISSPILLDLYPPPDFYYLISVSQVGLPFGSIVVGAGSQPSQIMLEFRGQLFADNLDSSHLIRAVRLVYEQAMSQISDLEKITPPLGGTRAYGA